MPRSPKSSIHQEIYLFYFTSGIHFQATPPSLAFLCVRCMKPQRLHSLCTFIHSFIPPLVYQVRAVENRFSFSSSFFTNCIPFFHILNCFVLSQAHYPILDDEKTRSPSQEVNSFLGMVLYSIVRLFWWLQRPNNFKTYLDLFQLDSSVSLSFLSGLKVHLLGCCTKKLQDQSLLDSSLDVPEHKYAGAELVPLHPSISSQGWQITTLLFGPTAHP